MRVFLFIWFLLPVLLPIGSGAQALLLQKPIPSARSMTTDELGNIYIIYQDNSLVKYNQNGDSLGNFRSIQNGTLQSVDAGNPLKLLLFYPEFSKVVFLDRMLSLKNEMDLKRAGLFQVTATAIARDGNLWAYDLHSAHLLKLDEQMQVMQQSDDLRSALGDVLQPIQLLDRDRKIFAVDTAKGIFIFDQFASALNRLDLFHVKHLQVLGNTLVYTVGSEWISYDLNRMQEQKRALPADPEFIMARIEKERIYYLYTHKLEIYRLSN